MKKVNKFLFLLLIPVLLTGQERLVKQGNEAYKTYSFKPAQDIYQYVLDKGYVSAEVLQKLGDSHYFNAEYAEAAAVYTRLFEEFPETSDPAYAFRYAQTLKSTGDIEAAEQAMDMFYERSGQQDLAGGTPDFDYLEAIKANSDRYTLQHFPYNTSYLEFAPSFYGENLLFSSDRDTGNLARYRHSWNSRDFMDVYQAGRDTIGESAVEKLKEVNSRWHESTTVLSPDGQTLYFTRNNNRDGYVVTDEDGYVRLKIYRAFLRDSIWTDVEEVSFNSDSYSVAHPALSPDGKTLFFASDMPGTYGFSDIFKVAINEDGSFGTPENLGPEVNTESRETFPFIDSEEVLYFASDGLPGLGGLDLFAVPISKLGQNPEVKNLGRPVNSPMDDFTYIIDGDTRMGYFSSNREGGLGGDDIYGFVETERLSFECVQVITGTVRDKITNEILAGATVRVIDESNEEVISTVTDTEGKYELSIDCDQGNFIRGSRQGYVPAEVFISPSEGQPQVIDLYLDPETLSAGFGSDLAKLLQLSTIYFDFDKYDIRPDAEVELQKVMAALEKYPSLKIKANSHTDSRGPDAYNLWLSQKRAEATVNYMISKGIAADRLQAEGYGETQLLNDCDDGVRCSAAEHQKNRRSEFIIYE
ncbi:OmpA family protein [Robiginitalea aurantiaca]|uniref:OmpA family protein n=1 Tax=Robiginitalea aurantiaca TaxID=3056915 RepID=A0ABT7WIT0_9FLAO|nr:OmpA family protein [Robiginitalea aurantiaca]MDM9632820.1 OmpA family protein [Robiginitalea aurantiaca]